VPNNDLPRPGELFKAKRKISRWTLIAPTSIEPHQEIIPVTPFDHGICVGAFLFIIDVKANSHVVFANTYMKTTGIIHILDLVTVLVKHPDKEEITMVQFILDDDEWESYASKVDACSA